jgi:hypothetical protein
MRADDRSLRSYADVVADYRRRYAAVHRAEMELFGNPRQTLAQAIRRACKSQLPKKHGMGLKRHPHQPYRAVSDAALLEAARRLEVREEEIATVTNFATLHELVDAAIQSISGIGELAVYDIADRIGTYRGLRPAEVFFHAGTRKGADALGLDAKRRTLPMTSLPAALRMVKPEEAEDILCIYRQALARIRQGADAPEPPRGSSCELGRVGRRLRTKRRKQPAKRKLR